MKSLVFFLALMSFATLAARAQDGSKAPVKAGTEESVAPATIASTVTIKVETAKCNSCVATIEKALGNVDGVERSDVDLETKTVTVVFDMEKTDVASLEDAIVKAGYDANNKKRDKSAYGALPACCQ